MIIVLPTFVGKVPWPTYRKQFEAAALGNKWTWEEKAKSLRGEALNVLLCRFPMERIQKFCFEMSQTKLPLFVSGAVIKGFGRGSKELGIPTANFPGSVVKSLPEDLNNGVYFGFGSVDGGNVYKMVMSVGWNPYYKNQEKSMETHLMHKFDNDFYDKELRVCVLGYIRGEEDFNSLDELIKAINSDIDTADTKLDSDEYSIYRDHAFFKSHQ
ncbi:hypothetical protein FQR65_LT09463 [Abscondita terminalis]|nr:hypothetical protein FQR65_LT09463 [Abscondita terminalis]